MKYALAALLIISISCLSAAEVGIAVSDPPNNVFSGISNCQISGTSTNSEYGMPTQAVVQLTINNPTALFYQITYEYYDFNSQAYKSPSSTTAVCGDQKTSWSGPVTLPPNTFTTCSLNIPVSLGGSGNGTITQELLRIHINEQGNPSVIQNIPLTFQLNHFELSQEADIESKETQISGALNDANNSINSACNGEYCCGLLNARQSMNNASGLFDAGKAALKSCLITSASSNISASLDASITAKSLSRNQECTASLSLLKDLDNKITQTQAAIDNSQNCSINDSLSLLAEAKSKMPTIKADLASDSYPNAQADIKATEDLLGSSVSSINCSAQQQANGNVLPITLPSTTNQPGKPSGICPLFFILLIAVLLPYAYRS